MRANWYTPGVVELEGDDPFELPVEEVGQRIDLSDPAGRLRVRLVELLEREARLFNIGVTCGLKERPDTVCLACPVCEAGDPESTLGKLCKIGREQEVVLTEIAALTREPCNAT